jgi:hypothetical protein
VIDVGQVVIKNKERNIHELFEPKMLAKAHEYCAVLYFSIAK